LQNKMSGHTRGGGARGSTNDSRQSRNQAGNFTYYLNNPQNNIFAFFLKSTPQINKRGAISKNSLSWTT
jgi:hypothetical protein